MEIIQDTVERYSQRFGVAPDFIISAPGRVNLIGEHTDYNDGFVLPVAIDRKIIIAAGGRTDSKVNLHSVDLLSSVSFTLEAIQPDRNNRWSNYAAGVATILQQKGYQLGGANFCIRGNIPIAAGLSSSAAISVASTLAFDSLNKLNLPQIDIIKIAQRSEIEFVGVQCGIMDQFISMMGKKNKALFLDCRSLAYEQVQFPQGVKLVICDTGAKRELADSAYNRRRAECDDAVRQLSKIYPNISALRDVTLEQFHGGESMLSPVARKRTLHVISENERVQQSVSALKANSVQKFGRLMTESHMSLKNNYEVSSKELDAFVEVAVSCDGVWGARMTGAGFGGSAICIVENEKIDSPSIA